MLSSISILIPTLNSEMVLEKCLEAIANQDYPKEKIEIIVADGGSTDRTLEIAKKYRVRIYKNSLKTGEVDKAVVLKHAKNELIALIDSDKILPDKNWLKRMTEPFSDPEIIGSEPWKFTYRKQDGFIDRYCALLGTNDPLCLFLGNLRRPLPVGKPLSTSCGWVSSFLVSFWIFPKREDNSALLFSRTFNHYSSYLRCRD